jgi:hypothetical protein
MKISNPGELARECEVFSRYLAGRRPDAYIQEKYAEAHRVTPDYGYDSRFDRVLVDFAAGGPRSAGLADAYSCWFARRSALRRKLILLVAILESCAPERGFLDAVEPTPLVLVALQLVGRGALFVIRLLAAALVFLPLQLALGAARPREE